MPSDPPPPAPRAPVLSARARRAKLDRAAGTLAAADFLHVRAAEEAADRLETVVRRFDRALLCGPGAPYLRERLTEAAGVEATVIACETQRLSARVGADLAAWPDALPFGNGAFDLVVSLMALHAVDDLPRALAEARRVLRPDGLFLALFPGERTLEELRGALREGEASVTGGLAPRVMPMVAVRDAGGLLQSVGFALPVADTVTVRARYGDPARLLSDLRAMGETNVATAAPRGGMRRAVAAAAMAAYPRDEEGRAPARFDLVALIGWAPDASQPRPLRPGSARVSLADAVREADRSEPDGGSG